MPQTPILSPPARTSKVAYQTYYTLCKSNTGLQVRCPKSMVSYGATYCTMCKSNFNPLIWTMDLYVQWLGNVHREYHSQTLSTDTSFLDARYRHLIPRSSVQIPYSQTLRKDTSFPDPWYTYLIPRPLAIYMPHSKD